jgi:hypothetical protein
MLVLGIPVADVVMLIGILSYLLPENLGLIRSHNYCIRQYSLQVLGFLT